MNAYMLTSDTYTKSSFLTSVCVEFSTEIEEKYSRIDDHSEVYNF